MKNYQKVRSRAVLAKLRGRARLCPWSSIGRLFDPRRLRAYPPPKAIEVVSEEGGFSLLRFDGRHEFWFPQGVGESVPVWNEYLVATWEHPANDHYYFRLRQGFGGGDVVFDCGACEGFFTRCALDRGAAKVICVEPAPLMAECLRRTFRDEIRDGRVELVEVALSSTPGSACFAMDLEDPFSGRVSDGEGATVPLATLDTVVETHGSPSFIKMDLEGWEYEALRGGEGTLRAVHPMLAITTYHHEWDYRVLSAFINGVGYRTIQSSAATFRDTDVPRPMMIHAC